MAWETSVIVGDEEYPVRFDREEAPTPEELEIIANDIVSARQGTQGQSLAGAMGANAAQSFYQTLVPGPMKGLGSVADFIPGAQEAGQFFRQLGSDLEEENVSKFPVDPAQAQRFPVKAAGAVGQAGGMALQAATTAGLGLPSQAVRGVTLGVAGLKGAGSGLDMSDRMGIKDRLSRAAMTFGYGGAEAGFEMLGGIGSKQFSDALTGAMSNFGGSALKQFGKASLIEGLEEVPTGQTQDFLTQYFAPEDPNRPGFSITGSPLPPSFFTKENFENRLEEFGLGAIGGSVFGATEALANDSSFRYGMRLREEARQRIEELQETESRTQEQEDELLNLEEQDFRLSRLLDTRGLPVQMQEDFLDQADQSRISENLSPLTPEEQEDLAKADAVEAVLPATAEALREISSGTIVEEEASEVPNPGEVAEDIPTDISPPLDPVASTLTDEQAASQYPELSLADLTALEVVSTGTSESDVYRRGDEAVKVAEEYNAPETVGARIRDKLLADRILGDGAVRVDGVYRGRNGVLNPVFAQPFIEGRHAEQAEIDQMMRDKGFVPHPMKRRRYLKVVDGILYEAQDVDQDNVIVDAQGVPHVIDASVYAVDQPTPEETQAVQNVQGTEPNASAGLPVVPDASQAEVSLPTQVRPQQERITPSATEASSVDEDVVVDEGSPMSIGEVIPPRSTPQEIYDAASRVPASNRFGEDKVFISDAYEEWKKIHPEDSFKAFKAKVFTAQRAGELDLSRADMVEALPLNKIADSEIEYYGATFHFIRLPEELIQAPSNASAKTTQSSQARSKGLQRVSDWVDSQLASQLTPERRKSLERFKASVLPVLERYDSLFPSIQLTGMPEGGGMRVGEDTLALKVDPVRYIQGLPANLTEAQLQSAAELALDEEFRHVVTLQLEKSSPKFAQDLQEVWDSLPTEIKELSARAYRASDSPSSEFSSDFQARHEFFRQYWQNAEVQSLTEQALAQDPSLRQKFQQLLQKFIDALRRLQAGAVPEVKPILDRLIAQATQRANELRKNAPKTPTQEAVPPPVQPAAPATQESEAPKTTSLKRAVVDAERKARGAEAIPTPERRGWTQAQLEARAALEANPRAGYELMKKLEFKDSPTTDFENALLLFHKVNISNALENAYREANTASAENRAEVQAVLDDVLNQYNEVDFHSRAVGTALGRGLNARKMVADLERKDISLANLMQQYRNVNGEALTAAEQKLVERNAKALQDAQSKVAEVESEEIKAKAAPVEKKLTQETQKEQQAERKAKRKTAKQIIAQKSKGGREWLKANVTTPDATSEQGLSAPSLNPRTEALANVGAEYIDEGADTLAKFTNKLVAEFGETARSQAAEIYERSKEIVEETQAEVERQEQAFRDKGDPKKVLEKGVERLKDKDRSELDKKLVADLYRSYIRSKPSMTPEQIVEAVRKQLTDLYPNATDSDVRVALTDYGKAKWPSKDAVKKREAEDKRQLRLVESIERVKRGEKPLKSGLQRDKPNARERELNKELRDLMREYGIETTSQGQLTSAREAIVNRLKNQIEELNRVLQGKAKLAPERRTVEYDQEINDLVKERDSLKSYVDDLTGPSASGKWNKKKQAAAKASAEYYRRRIQQQDLESKISPSFEATEKTKKLQQEAVDAKAEFDTLRDASGITAKEALASAKSSLERQISELEDQIQNGTNPTSGKPKLKFAELDPLKQQVKALKATVRLMEGSARTPEQKRAENAKRSLEKSIAELERRITQGDLSPKAKREPVRTPELDALRAQRDSLRETLDELQEAASPRRIPEEIALDNLKRRIEKKRQEHALQLTEYLEEPLVDTRFTERRNAALYEQEQTRKRWNEELLERKLSNRSRPKKILDTGVEGLNLMRAILTSFDLSAVLRQSGFISLGNPKRLAEAFTPMLKAFVSDQARFEAMEKLKKDPDYSLSQRAGLFMSDMDSTDINKMEEAFFSRWVDKIPKALGGEIIRGSQRAYTTFLNIVRLSQFKAMKNALTESGRVTKEEGEAIANFINVATGRGKIGFNDKAQANPFLATVFFSPRLVASRFNLLAGQPLYGGNARTRKLIAKEYGKFLIGAGLVLAFAALFRDPDDEEKFLETDPRSADFLKARFGETRLDLFAGLLQATVLLSRLGSGQTKKLSGEVVDIRGEDKPFTAPGAGDIIWRFTRSKLSPAIGSVVNLLEGEDYAGKPTSLKQEAQKMVVPMSLSSFPDVMEEQGAPRGVALWLTSLFGAGLQTYKPEEK